MKYSLVFLFFLSFYSIALQGQEESHFEVKTDMMSVVQPLAYLELDYIYRENWSVSLGFEYRQDPLYLWKPNPLGFVDSLIAIYEYNNLTAYLALTYRIGITSDFTHSLLFQLNVHSNLSFDYKEEYKERYKAIHGQYPINTQQWSPVRFGFGMGYKWVLVDQFVIEPLFLLTYYVSKNSGINSSRDIHILRIDGRLFIKFGYRF